MPGSWHVLLTRGMIVCLLSCLIMCVPDAHAQESSSLLNIKQIQSFECSGDIHEHPVPYDSEYKAAGNEIERVNIAMNARLRVSVREHAYLESLGYGTEVVVVNEGGEEKHFPIFKLMRSISMQFVHVAMVCLGSESRMLVLEYEGDSTGGSEGFVIIRYNLSSDQVSVHVLPVVVRGKIVVFKKRPNYVQIWTEAPIGIIECEACNRYYKVRSCHLRKGRYLCNAKGKIVGPYSSGEIDDLGIELK